MTEGAWGFVRHRWFRAAFVVVLCLLGTRHYWSVVDRIYPVDLWLVWPLAMMWGWMAVLSVSCLCVGHFLLERVLKLDVSPLEALVHSMAVGLVTFVMCMYVAGALHLYGPVFAVALPALLIAIGRRSVLRLARRVWADLRSPVPANPFVWLVSGLGACCVGLVYLGVLSPDSLNYDSTWSHLVIAQDYAREGGIIKFLGNYNMGVPHLASIVHAWGFQVPGLDRPVFRWMMALHNEFGLFCWTLVGIAAGVRRMLGEPRVRGSWSGFFLFPIIFVYDNNLAGAADHVAAFFMPSFLLASCEVWERFEPRAAALLAFPAAGALLTKYQAFYLFVPLAGLIAVRGGLLAWRIKRGSLRLGDPRIGFREIWRTPLVLGALGALLVLPHFLKNAIFYHNPFYPFAQDVFTGSTPQSPNFGPLIKYHFTDDYWKPKGTTYQKLKHALELCYTFSFEPHYSFTKNFPAFGSLFTLLLPSLLVLSRSSRIWIGAIIASGALFMWGFTYNIDRNLQIFLPLMVCVTVALIVRTWRLGWIARAGLVPLVLFQIVWGGDALFYSADERLQNAFRLIRSGYDGHAKRRFDGYRSQFLAVRKAVPKDARILYHTSHLTLGIDREVVMDWDAFQGFISYDELSTPREVYDYLRVRGITHILMEPHVRSAPTKQEEVLFGELVSRHAQPLGSFGSFRLYRFPTEAPPVRAPYRVVTIGLGTYADGLYPIKKLNTHEYLPPYVHRYASPDDPLPADDAARAALLSNVDAVLLATTARPGTATAAVLRERFTEVTRYQNFTLYLAGQGGRSI